MHKSVGTLNGKVALVTGGSRGIGAAIALSLAEAGADIAINFRAAQLTPTKSAVAIRKADAVPWRSKPTFRNPAKSAEWSRKSSENSDR